MQLEDVPCVKRKDYDLTQAEVFLREDNVQTIHYPDGTRYTLHSDGTKFTTRPQGTITVEHVDYNTLTIDLNNNSTRVEFFDKTIANIQHHQQSLTLSDQTQLLVEQSGDILLKFSDGTQYYANLNEGLLKHQDNEQNQFQINKYQQQCFIKSTKDLYTELNE